MDAVRENIFSSALGGLDARLGREIARLRTRYQLSLDEFRGLYVSDEHVDSLLAAARQDDHDTSDAASSFADGLAADPLWGHIVDTFGLSLLDQELIVIAMAPEIDLKYETLYAYLNDDVTRKSPTADLAGRLLAPRVSREAVLGALGPASTLHVAHLIETIDPPAGRPSLLNVGFAAHPSLSRYLQHVSLGVNDGGAGDQPQDVVLFSTQGNEEIGRLGRLMIDRTDSPAVVFDGPDPNAHRRAARLVAREVQRPLRWVDVTALRRAPSLAVAVSTLTLEARLERAIIGIAGVEAAVDAEGRLVPETTGMLDNLTTVPLILSAAGPVPWAALVGSRRVRVVSLGTPGYSERLQLWGASLRRAGLSTSDAERRALADRYVFTATEIAHAADAARDRRQADTPGGDAAHLADAARAIARQRGGQRDGGHRAEYGWDDLVLPPHTLSRLKEVAAAIRLRHVVFSDWAFGRRSGTGTGVKTLFAGPSGTGKTMAAGVIARELGLDLVKIDLAATVSKYIGETEKNLDRIFAGGQAGGSLLFFDEADAIFGKRSDVKEAHDRYANIEVAYLLQKLEEYDGAVILATNLRRNIDDAFLRRLHYAVDFPQPDAALRERLWRGMFPAEAPLAADVDFPFLAKQFELTGGDIRNVVFDAAFAAADTAQSIGMPQLIRALVQQLTKQGRTTSASSFHQYQRFVLGAAGGETRG